MLEIEGFIHRNFDDYTSTNGDEIRVNCPICIDDKQHMYINVVNHKCHCFKCGYSRGWIGLVMDMTGLAYWQALGELYAKPRMVDFHSTFNGGKLLELEKVVELPDGFENLLTSQQPIALKMRQYLAKRGFTDRHVTRYNLGVSDLKYRIIIPIEHDYWQGRRLYDWMEPKYINPEAKSKDFIFNSEALHSYDEVVICEGAFSAMAIGENGIALIGKECPEEKFERLASAKVGKYILAVEIEARKQMAELATKFNRIGKEVELWLYGQDSDPADDDGKTQRVSWSFKERVRMAIGG